MEIYANIHNRNFTNKEIFEKSNFNANEGILEELNKSDIPKSIWKLTMSLTIMTMMMMMMMMITLTRTAGETGGVHSDLRWCSLSRPLLLPSLSFPD